MKVTSKRMCVILGSSKSLLNLIGLSSKSSTVVFRRNLPNSVVNSVYVFILLQTIIALIVYAYEQKMDVDFITSSTYISMSLTLTLMIYIDWIREKVSIQLIFERLQKIVVKSE